MRQASRNHGGDLSPKVNHWRRYCVRRHFRGLRHLCDRRYLVYMRHLLCLSGEVQARGPTWDVEQSPPRWGRRYYVEDPWGCPWGRSE